MSNEITNKLQNNMSYLKLFSYAYLLTIVCFRTCSATICNHDRLAPIKRIVFEPNAEPIDPEDTLRLLRQLQVLCDDETPAGKIESIRVEALIKANERSEQSNCDFRSYSLLKQLIEDYSKTNNSNVFRYLEHNERELFKVCLPNLSDKVRNVIGSKLTGDDAIVAELLVECLLGNIRPEQKGTNSLHTLKAIDAIPRKDLAKGLLMFMEIEGGPLSESLKADRERFKGIYKTIVSDLMLRIFTGLRDSIDKFGQVIEREEFANQMDEFTFNWLKVASIFRDLLNMNSLLVEETFERFKHRRQNPEQTI